MTHDDAIELKPCPFCGEARIFLNAPSEHWPRGSINCPACMAVMPGAVGEPGIEAELIQQWNERAALGDGVVVPREPTPAMLDSAVAFALNVTISGKYNWSAYMRDVYRTMLRAAPPASKPEQGGVHGA